MFAMHAISNAAAPDVHQSIACTFLNILQVFRIAAVIVLQNR
jgi:hypothetical protein